VFIVKIPDEGKDHTLSNGLVFIKSIYRQINALKFQNQRNRSFACCAVQALRA
jgi:hypothetical protein